MNKLNQLPICIICMVLMSCSNEQYAVSEVMVTPDGYAIHGYDPVAYFTDGGPKKGLIEHSVTWHEAKWLFSSEDNKNLFLQSPDTYAPQYGGWCAFGMAEGYAAETDPLNAWTIHNKKLYLNWDLDITREWAVEREKYLIQSETNWPDIKNSLKSGSADIYWKDDA